MKQVLYILVASVVLGLLPSNVTPWQVHLILLLILASLFIAQETLERDKWRNDLRERLGQERVTPLPPHDGTPAAPRDTVAAANGGE